MESNKSMDYDLDALQVIIYVNQNDTIKLRNTTSSALSNKRDLTKDEFDKIFPPAILRYLEYVIDEVTGRMN